MAQTEFSDDIKRFLFSLHDQYDSPLIINTSPCPSPQILTILTKPSHKGFDDSKVNLRKGDKRRTGPTPL